MFTRIDNILIKMRLKVGKLFDMYKTYVYVEKTIDRFHPRDRWPQWGGETIRNIWIRKS
jgi:hypothetical protein